MDFEKIAAQLNAAGIKPRRGDSKTVDKILAHQVRQAA
jgi:hypothetical protein